MEPPTQKELAKAKEIIENSYKEKGRFFSKSTWSIFSKREQVRSAESINQLRDKTRSNNNRRPRGGAN